jgi:bacterioferritin-associated ferredoxin
MMDRMMDDPSAVATVASSARKICLCMSVTDREIAACYAAGHTSVDEIRSITRACTRCFGCEADLLSFYNDVLVPGRFRRQTGGWRGRVGRLAKHYDLYRVAQRYYHRHVRWRVQPNVFGSLVVERPDLHTRVFVANLDAGHGRQFSDVTLRVRLLDEAGAVVSATTHALPRGRTLVLETGDLLGGRGALAGVLLVEGHRRHIGSLRPYAHYYNDHSIASTHDQWTPDETRHHGFCTVISVGESGAVETWVSVSNLETGRYRSKVFVTNHRGVQRDAVLELPPGGTVVARPVDLLGPLDGFLEGQLGTLRFENWSHRAMYYYLAHDRVHDTWNANHL